MPIHGHHARAVAARGVVAHEVPVVVPCRLLADRVLELRDDGQGREDAAAGGLRAADPLGADDGEGGGEAGEGEGVVAVAALQREGRAVLEADGVRDLALEGVDVGGLGGGGGGGGDAVSFGVEAEAFGEADGVGAGDGGAEALDGGEDLLVEVPVDVRF